MKRFFTPPVVIGLAIVAILAWVVVVIGSAGWGWNWLNRPWSFTTTGALGDSFGVVSAFMASAAAYYAYKAYRDARDQNAVTAQQTKEASFLALLQHRLEVLAQVRFTTREHSDGKSQTIEVRGQEALDKTDTTLRTASRAIDAVFFAETTGKVWGLPNLFRFTYHVVSYADRQFPVPAGRALSKSDPAYQQVRFLRAQMSNSELLLVALNCLLGEGREKFKSLVERYALLHNLDPNLTRSMRLTELFERSAFGLEPDDRKAHFPADGADQPAALAPPQPSPPAVSGATPPGVIRRHLVPDVFDVVEAPAPPAVDPTAAKPARKPRKKSPTAAASAGPKVPAAGEAQSSEKVRAGGDKEPTPRSGAAKRGSTRKKTKNDRGG